MGQLTDLTGDDWSRIAGAVQGSLGPMPLLAFLETHFPQVHGEVPVFGLGHADVVHRATQIANQYGVLDRLLVTLSKHRPDRPDLRALVHDYQGRPGWTAAVEDPAPRAPPARPLGADLTHLADDNQERLTQKGDPFLDPEGFTFLVDQVKRQVCQVRCGAEYGTGFLIGPDLVLTCHHVVERHLGGSVSADKVQVRFDYRRKPDGVLIKTTGWLPIDPGFSIPSDAALDYAVLKLARAPGGDRGHQTLPATQPAPDDATPVLILGHPGKLNPPPVQQPFRWSVSSTGYQGTLEAGRRIVYSTSTLSGSSGSPVFDHQYRLIAIHKQGGERDPNDTTLFKNNRGVAISRIAQALPAELVAESLARHEGTNESGSATDAPEPVSAVQPAPTAPTQPPPAVQPAPTPDEALEDRLYEVMVGMIPSVFGEVVYYSRFNEALFESRGQAGRARELIRHFRGQMGVLKRAVERARKRPI